MFAYALYGAQGSVDTRRFTRRFCVVIVTEPEVQVTYDRRMLTFAAPSQEGELEALIEDELVLRGSRCPAGGSDPGMGQRWVPPQPHRPSCGLRL